MKQIGYWRKLEDDEINKHLPFPVENGHLPLAVKQKVAKYLDSGEIHIRYRGFSTCRFCGKMNGTVCLTDGEFIYPQGYSHYILDHNVMPDLDLLEKVTTKFNY